MNKEKVIIIGIICALMVIGLVAVFVVNSKTVDVPMNVLFTMNGEDYTVEECRAFEAIKSVEAGEEYTKSSGDDLNSLISEFIEDATYYTAAKLKNVTLSSETDYSAEYDEKSQDLAKAGVSKEDYIKIKSRTALASELKNNFTKYYEVPTEYYNAIVENAKEQGLYNTYSFRIMQIPYEVKEETSGDEADVTEATEGEDDSQAETTSDASATENESGDSEPEKDMSKDAQRIVAEDVLKKIQSGEDFEQLTKEYGTMRFTFKGSGYTIVQGDLEYATGLVLESKLGGSGDVVKAFKDLKPGECTDIIDEVAYNCFEIIKMESVEDGFVGEADEELRTLLLTEKENMDALVSSTEGIEFQDYAAGFNRLTIN